MKLEVNERDIKNITYNEEIDNKELCVTEIDYSQVVTERYYMSLKLNEEPNYEIYLVQLNEISTSATSVIYNQSNLGDVFLIPNSQNKLYIVQEPTNNGLMNSNFTVTRYPVFNNQECLQCVERDFKICTFMPGKS